MHIKRDIGKRQIAVYTLWQKVILSRQYISSVYGGHSVNRSYVSMVS